jgi:hypothetical protein
LGQKRAWGFCVCIINAGMQGVMQKAAQAEMFTRQMPNNQSYAWLALNALKLNALKECVLRC